MGGKQVHCIGCDYSLKNLEHNRCPECGRAFDPKNPKTYRPLPSELRKQLAINDAKSNLYAIVACAIIAVMFGLIDLIFADVNLIQFTGCFSFLAIFGILIVLVRTVRILRGWLPDRKY